MPDSIQPNIKLESLVVHNGSHHLDEVALAALFIEMGVIGPYQIRRISDDGITSKMLNNPLCYVGDTGGVYDLALSNGDHHQDKSLPSAFAMGVEWLTLQGFDFPDAPAWNELVQAVSDHDTGRNRVTSPLSMAMYVRQLNQVDNGFYKAVQVVRPWLKIALNVAKSQVENVGRWRDVPNLGGYGVWKDNESFIPDWTAMTRPDDGANGINFMVMPSDREEDVWVLYAKDSSQFPIEKTNRPYWWYHGFIAKYHTMQTAVEDAKHMAKRVKDDQ